MIPRWKGIEHRNVVEGVSKVKKKKIRKCKKTTDHGFGGKNGHANFKQPYPRRRETKSGPRQIDGNMKKRRTRWDGKC